MWQGKTTETSSSVAYKETEQTLVNSKKENAGLFQPKFGSNMDKPKCWVKNVIEKKNTVESES